MFMDSTKAQEIKRLTTPLTIKDFKAYDCEGKLVNCVETLSEVKYIMEPKDGILTDNEIIQYAPESKAASKIRLNRGVGKIEDVLLVHESLPWIFALYYVVAVCFLIPAIHDKNSFSTFILLILIILPLVYFYYIFNMKNYEVKTKQTKPLPIKDIPKPSKPKDEVKQESLGQIGIASLKIYADEIKNLKVIFDVKEEVVGDLIEKRFQPPQITYDKFMSVVENCHKLFYNQVDAASNIINLAAEDTPRIREELENKINIMKTIINQIEELTNELVINISSDAKSDDDVENLLDDMENLIESVKEY